MDGKEDYSDLPPNQKKKKLQAKVHELNKQVRTMSICLCSTFDKDVNEYFTFAFYVQVAQEQAAMEGLMKMKGVYETNPTLGDPMTVEGTIPFSSYYALIETV